MISTEDLALELPAVEDLSYSGAFIKQAVLKRPQATWSQSLFSCCFEDKVIPNRDYPYQGLHTLINGENWKFLDGIAIGIKKEGRYLPLEASSVLLYPWKMIYRYIGENFKLDVDYYLLRYEKMSEGAARVLLTLQAPEEYSKDIAIDIEPYADIRHMYEASNPEAHQGAVEDGKLLIRRAEKCIVVGAVDLMPKLREWKESINWWYKLGSGFRELRNGEIKFKGESKQIVSLGELEFSWRNKIILIITCGKSREAALKLFERASREYNENEAIEREIAAEVIHKLDLKSTSKENLRAIISRVLAMLSFGMYIKEVKIQEAGDFWFRSPWFRDTFEGLLSNLETLLILDKQLEIKRCILLALDYLNENGQVPNRITPYGEVDYNGADATLLLYITAGRYLNIVRDKKLASLILRAFEATLKGYMKANLETVNGTPVLHENGLISIPAWHSWCDSKRWYQVEGISALMPTRLSEEMAINLIQEFGKNAESEACKPKFFLPEINAQWIKALAFIVEITKLAPDNARNRALRESCELLLTKAKYSFRELFWSKNLLYNAITLHGKKDSIVGSLALTAMALLVDLNIFSEDEIKAFMENIKSSLLAYRNGKPFGVILKNSLRRIYFDDNEYHEGVVWPRDTPYLIHLLQKTGEVEMIKQILISNLEHQMTEAAIFYNSELFSSGEEKLIPVKNPVQWWSQWCDPYLNFQMLL
ncbi:MAG: amylo-alpha-1,6-glucosidase [Methanocellales archaeon]